MRKTVIVYEVYETPIEVDADNDEEALDIAERSLRNNIHEQDSSIIPEGTYSYPLDKSEWNVFDS